MRALLQYTLDLFGADPVGTPAPARGRSGAKGRVATTPIASPEAPTRISDPT